MNIFYLDEDIDKCAEAHFDVHVTKMQLEITQMLSTNTWIDEVLGYTPRKVTSDETTQLRSASEYANLPTEVRYKPAFFNHPCTIWMRSSYENYEYSVLLVDALDQEAQWRGFNAHKSAKVARGLPLPRKLPSSGFTQPAQAMPEEFFDEESVRAYRKYYRGAKASLAQYTRREPPIWWWKRESSLGHYRDALSLIPRTTKKEDQLVYKKMAIHILQKGPE